VDLIGHLDRLVEIGDGNYREKRAKALVSDQAVVDVVDLDDGRLDEEIVFVHGTAYNDLAVTRVQHLLQALVLLLVDDTAVVRGVSRAVGIELGQCVLHLLNKGWHHFAVNKGAVLADADLAGVQRLGPQQALRCQLGVGMLCDDGGILATKLEHKGSERLGCLLRDDPSDCLRARVEDRVPLLVEQRRCLWNGALDDSVARGVERFADDLLEDGSGVGGRLGGLDDGGATGCNGANEGANSELDGEVVGSTQTVSICLAQLELETHPIIRAVPNGSFLMRGPTNLLVKAMSAGFSSFAKRGRLLAIHMQSFMHHEISTR
jgi:hypothetical protein